MTSWVRLEGDLRVREGGIGDLYELHDLNDDDLYVLLHNAASLPPGRQFVTGRISPRRAETGNIGTLVADVPAVPKANEPFAVILFPAAVGAFLAIGRQRRLSGPTARGSLQGGAAPARTGSGGGGPLERADRGRDRVDRRVDPGPRQRRGRARPLRRDDRIGRSHARRSHAAPGAGHPRAAVPDRRLPAGSRGPRADRRPAADLRRSPRFATGWPPRSARPSGPRRLARRVAPDGTGRRIRRDTGGNGIPMPDHPVEARAGYAGGTTSRCKPEVP